MESGIVLAVLGAALATVLAGVGSSLGIKAPASKGAGVLSEQPTKFTPVLILSSLPGTQGMYGLLIAVMILTKLGGELTKEVGMLFLLAGSIMGFAGLFSGWLQGKVAAAAVGAVARGQANQSHLIIISALIETYAILGLIIAIMVLNAA